VLDFVIYYYDVLFPLAGKALQAGEGRYLRDDGEASRESAAPAGSDVGSYRPKCAQQVPGRIQ